MLKDLALNVIGAGGSNMLTIINEHEFWKDVHWSFPIAQGMPDVCWYYLEDKGCGRFKGMEAHKYAWQLYSGPLPPPGYHLHHLCKNHWCVNPSHLVIASEITHPRWDAVKLVAFCPRTHKYNESNPIVNAAGRRLCDQCPPPPKSCNTPIQKEYLAKLGKLANVHGTNTLKRLLGGTGNVTLWLQSDRRIHPNYFAMIDELCNQLG
jgi:hypothetical protein